MRSNTSLESGPLPGPPLAGEGVFPLPLSWRRGVESEVERPLGKSMIGRRTMGPPCTGANHGGRVGPGQGTRNLAASPPLGVLPRRRVLTRQVGG